MTDTRLFTFTWNCANIKTCKFKSKCKDKLDENCSYCSDEKCYVPTFAQHLVDYVVHNEFNIVFISTQEDRASNNLHSEYLLQYFKEKDYIVLDKSQYKYMNIGIPGFKRGLSGSLFFKESYLIDLEKKSKIKKIENKKTMFGINQKKYKSIIINNDNYSCSAIFGNSCGICINVKINAINYSFINIQLQFNTKTLKTYKKKKNYDKYRLPVLNNQSACFSKIINYFKKKFKSDVIIVAGDLNYRIKYSEQEGAKNINNKITKFGTMDDLKFLYTTRDELHSQINSKNIQPFLEGVDNTGPMFLPTFKIVKHKYGDYKTCDGPKIRSKHRDKTNKGDRLSCQCHDEDMTKCKIDYSDKKCYKLGKRDQRAPSWSDRILYMNTSTDLDIRCIEYSSYDFSQIMAMSDHVSVYGSYRITFN
jgi:transposase-like protein